MLTETTGENVMHVILPKLTVNGTFTMTAILASSMHGMEPREISVNGHTVRGTKVYGPYGSFKVLCTPAALVAAQTKALTTGQAVALSEPPAKLQIAAPKKYVSGHNGHKKLSSGYGYKNY